MWKLLLMAAIVAGATPAAAQSVKAGVEAWQRTDYPAAVGIWRPLAEAGNADAAFNMGQAYRLGRGVPLNLAVAHSWFERAARKGHLDAQTTLGLLLFDSGSRPDGLRWLKTAAERGEPRALLIYGTALFNGDGVAEDRVLAYAYISRAAAQGLGPAKGTLAELDQILPLETRQKGVAIAQAEAASGKAAPVKAPAKAAAKPAVKAAAKPTAPPPASAAKGNWRVQLGAFGKRSSAEALFKKLSGNAALAGRQSYLIPAGSVTRLQAGPFESRQAAAAACAALSAGGQACFPVPAK
jgi:cell division septation protein DedD